MSQEGELLVVLINRITLAKVSLPASQVAEYLKKHTLYQEMPQYEPVHKKVRTKKIKKAVKPPKDEPKTRKRTSPEVEIKTSPNSTPSESATLAGAIKRARSDKLFDEEAKNASVNPNNNLLMIPLGEVLEIIRLFASSTPTPSCADWSSIAAQACKGRISASDAEYIANEFIPTVHYRPSVGMVVMERSMRNHVSDYHRHKLTLRRLKQGLPLMVEKFKEVFLGQENVKDDATPQPATPHDIVHMESFKEELQDEPEEDVVGSRRPGRPSNRTSVTVFNFETLAPPEYLSELRSRAQTTITRYENGEVPLYALKPVNESDAMAAGLTATGRVKRRYETKAIRLAKAAAAVAGGDPMESSPNQSMLVDTPISELPKPSPSPSFSLHSIFQKTAEQFARSRTLSSTSSSPDQIV